MTDQWALHLGREPGGKFLTEIHIAGKLILAGAIDQLAVLVLDQVGTCAIGQCTVVGLTTKVLPVQTEGKAVAREERCALVEADATDVVIVQVEVSLGRLCGGRGRWK